MIINNRIKALDILINLKDKCNFREFPINISLDTTGVCISLNIEGQNMCELLDSTIGNYEKYDDTVPFIRFSKKDLSFQSFCYCESSDYVCVVENQLELIPIYREMYFIEHLKIDEKNWRTTHLYKDNIILCDDTFDKSATYFKLIINDSFSFILNKDSLVGCCIDLNIYFSGWNSHERMFLGKYLSFVSNSEWMLNDDDDENESNLMELINSYKGSLFKKNFQLILREMKDRW